MTGGMGREGRGRAVRGLGADVGWVVRGRGGGGV